MARRRGRAPFPNAGGWGYGPLALMEPGLVTLAKIVGTLLFAMGLVPWIFLLSPGDSSEPSDEL